MPADPHELLIVPGSAYTVGTKPNTGQLANLRNPEHYPVEALCRSCGTPVRREKPDPACPDWMHLDRKPGELG